VPVRTLRPRRRVSRLGQQRSWQGTRKFAPAAGWPLGPSGRCPCRHLRRPRQKGDTTPRPALSVPGLSWSPARARSVRQSEGEKRQSNAARNDVEDGQCPHERPLHHVLADPAAHTVGSKRERPRADTCPDDETATATMVLMLITLPHSLQFSLLMRKSVPPVPTPQRMKPDKTGP
jgi:hypothetical protein